LQVAGPFRGTLVLLDIKGLDYRENHASGVAVAVEYVRDRQRKSRLEPRCLGSLGLAAG
jgi:hypothetical protein